MGISVQQQEYERLVGREAVTLLRHDSERVALRGWASNPLRQQEGICDARYISGGTHKAGVEDSLRQQGQEGMARQGAIKVGHVHHTQYHWAPELLQGHLAAHLLAKVERRQQRLCLLALYFSASPKKHIYLPITASNSVPLTPSLTSAVRGIDLTLTF